MNKKTIILIFVVIALLAGAGVWKWKDELVPEPKEQVQNDQSLVDPTQETSIDTSNWKTYRNEEYGFEVKYPDGWFVRVDKTSQENFGRVSVDFSNSDKFFRKGGTFIGIMEIGILIYDTDNKNGSEEFVKNMKASKQYAKAEKILIKDDLVAKLYSIEHKNEEVDETWDISLPISSAFVKGKKYEYNFIHATEIGKELQQKEIYILKEMLKSFSFLP